MTASDILTAALSHLKKRGEDYDNQQGERSIPLIVDTFNLITGHNLTYKDGWLFMIVLKLIRIQQNKNKLDSYEDLAAYAALMGEEENN